MDENELPNTICSLTFENDPSAYFAIGTGYDVSEQSAPTRGRILIMQANEQKQLRLVAEIELMGAVYTLKAFQGMLVAGVNSRVRLLRTFPMKDVI